MKLQSINPATGELIERFDEISDGDLEAALARAEQTFRPTAGLPSPNAQAGSGRPHRSWKGRRTSGRG